MIKLPASLVLPEKNYIPCRRSSLNTNRACPLA